MIIHEIKITDNFIHVEYSPYENSLFVEGITVDREKFELFVHMNEFLNWTMDYFDPETDQHIQKTGTYSLEEYYEDRKALETDLIKYIKTKQDGKQEG